MCISVHIFVTGTSTTPSLDYRSTEEQTGSDESTPVTPVETWKAKPLDTGSELKTSSMSLLAQLPAVKVTLGRPSLAKLLREEVDETNGGPMWVTGELHIDSAHDGSSLNDSQSAGRSQSQVQFEKHSSFQ